MSEDDEKPEYEVGYARPPKATQFKTGDRGNPHGRPKGSKNTSTLVLKVADEKLLVNEKGRQRSMSRRELGIRQLANKYAQGDPKAFREFNALLQSAEAQKSLETRKDETIAEADQATFDNFLKRMQDSFSGLENSEPSTPSSKSKIPETKKEDKK